MTPRFVLYRGYGGPHPWAFNLPNFPHDHLIDAIAWCIEQFGPDRDDGPWHYANWTIYFADESAATAFRLRWT